MLLWSSLPLVLFFLLLSAGWHGYQRLTDEQLVAALTFEPLAPQRFEATLYSGDLCHPRQYLILGDQWRLDARFVKWKYWANLLGLDARYRLERIEGRYRDSEAQNREPLLAHALDREHLLDPGELARALGPFNLFLDTHYGSSTYREIDPSLRYLVYRTQSGLITRTSPRPQMSYEGGTLTLEINHACADRTGLWLRSARWLEGWFVRGPGRG
jgi:hypothetical protein